MQPIRTKRKFALARRPDLTRTRSAIASVATGERGLYVTIVELTDYVQPNLAFADGALDANASQQEVFLKEILR
jgi:D-methionine transport system substrate-binding protein